MPASVPCHPNLVLGVCNHHCWRASDLGACAIMRGWAGSCSNKAILGQRNLNWKQNPMHGQIDGMKSSQIGFPALQKAASLMSMAGEEIIPETQTKE